MRPTGYVTLGKLLGATTAAPLQEIIEDSFRTIPADQPEKDVAYAFNHYHLISAPVVDADNRLVGVITIDDAMTVLDEEYEEDMMRLAGVGEGSLSDHVIETLKGRFPWLAVNLCTAIVASMVISMFEATIAQFVALAVLMPIVASMGGNAGMQTLAVTIRAIATKELSSSNINKIVGKEFLIGVLNGIIFAIITGIIVQLWFKQFDLSIIIAASMVLNMIVAGLFGILIPVTLKKMNIDPALASSVFVTTVTDVIGFLSFLGIGSLVFL
jgi:magnesium transporter